MYLAIDVGNTTIGVALIAQNKIEKQVRFSTHPLLDANALAKCIEQNFGKSFDDVIISSVVPAVSNSLQECFEKYYKISPKFIKYDTPTLLEIKLKNPAELGADLLVDGVAGAKRFPEGVLVVDLGTATKFIVVKNNQFLGGSIAPGVLSSFKGLIENAALLEDTVLTKPEHVVENTTIGCLQSGLIYGTVAMVDGMIEKIQQELGPLNVIITGGLADSIISGLKASFTYCPDLIFEGIMQIYEMNYQ